MIEGHVAERVLDGRCFRSQNEERRTGGGEGSIETEDIMRIGSGRTLA